MGKTSLAMNIAENAAVGHKIPVAIFSLEMPGSQLAMRMMASLGRINAHKVRTGKLDDDDWPRLTSAVSLLNEAPIFIDDTAGITPMELRARARRLKREHGLGMIIVDYLQLMQSTDTEENRATEISNITRSLKGLARELEVPLIAHVAAQSQRRESHRQASGDVGPARVRRHRAGRRRDPVHLPRRGLQQARVPRRAPPRSSSASNVTAPSAKCA